MERLTLDVRAEDFEFLASFAAYRNALAKVQERKIKKQWSRKSLAESFLSIQCAAMREQLAAMFEAVGPLPPFEKGEKSEESRKAMEQYAAAVLKWEADSSTKKKR